MDQSLTQTSVLLHELKNHLISYENAKEKVQEKECENIVRSTFDRLFQMCDRLDILVNKEPAQRRAQLKQRVNEMKYDVKHYQTAFSNIGLKKEQRYQDEVAREQLLNRRFTSNNSNHNNGETQIQLDRSLDFHDRINETDRHIDTLMDQGKQTLHSLRQQHYQLKSIGAKMANIGNLLGLSSTVIRSIERRVKSDWYLLFGGMAVTLLILFGLYKWLV